MSSDKRKKWNRAMAFIRRVNEPVGAPLYGYGGKMSTSQEPTSTMRYCVDRGLAKLRREKRGGSHCTRTIFDTGLQDV